MDTVATVIFKMGQFFGIARLCEVLVEHCKFFFRGKARQGNKLKTAFVRGGVGGVVEIRPPSVTFLVRVYARLYGV
ncbi:hypothetical protein DSUL_60051 [Desulfovibrionales bacterium]